MRSFPGLFLILLLLTGCAAHKQPDTAAAQSESRESIVLYDPDSPQEAPGHRALQQYALKEYPCSKLLPLGEDILLLAQEPEATTLAILNLKAGTISHFLSLPSGISVSASEEWILCFDPESRESMILNHELQIVHSIPPPEGMTGIPVLSSSGTTLYYCTEEAIRAMDLDSGISRILKASPNPEQSVAGLILDDAVLVCRMGDSPAAKTVFLCTQTGGTLDGTDALQSIHSSGENYYAQIQQGNLPILVFGTPESSPSFLLLPEDTADQFVLAPRHSLLGVRHSSDASQLDLYDLHSGKRTAALCMPSRTVPFSFASGSDGNIWFLQEDNGTDGITLCCWNPVLSPANDGACYANPYFTRNAPDSTGIAQCLQSAENLADRFGIGVLLYRDAVVNTNEYRLTYEHLAPVLKRELNRLEQNLTNYPAEILQKLSARFDGITVCILRQITPLSPGSETPHGITVWDGHHVYICLAAGTDTERALYHEICHLIDTIVLGSSSAYDTWSQWNPTGFQYDYDYITNRNRNSTAYLLENNRYFADMYSMSFPKEDRARIMEYAMTAGNAYLFQTDAMQGKLRTLCTGIREAFDLKNSTQAFLWEQYLRTPLGTPA